MKHLKKTVSMMLAFFLTCNLVGCGDFDISTAVDTLDTVSKGIDEIEKLTNSDLLDEQLIGEIIDISEGILDFKNEGNSDTTQDYTAEIQHESKDYLEMINKFKPLFDKALNDPSFTKIKSITEIIIELSGMYNEIAPLAIENGWKSDASTSQELVSLINFFNKVKSDGFVKHIQTLDEKEINELLEQCQKLKEAMPELLEKVSRPYDK